METVHPSATGPPLSPSGSLPGAMQGYCFRDNCVASGNTQWSTPGATRAGFLGFPPNGGDFPGFVDIASLSGARYPLCESPPARDASGVLISASCPPLRPIDIGVGSQAIRHTAVAQLIKLRSGSDTDLVRLSPRVGCVAVAGNERRRGPNDTSILA